MTPWLAWSSSEFVSPHGRRGNWPDWLLSVQRCGFRMPRLHKTGAGPAVSCAQPLPSPERESQTLFARDLKTAVTRCGCG